MNVMIENLNSIESQQYPLGEQGICHVRADAVDEKLDSERHEQGVDVKAVTPHRFSLE
ncbi:hypothetical protein [Nitrosococcus oceani]|uniref:hypothetical protein n=2 Tax=Nitrosococcus oceani TaxID=1229 RepID=UPI0011909528|nr:hypothetical protein [Nitrosococcus oceani]GEM20722.1 hypothetical protein NONS58_21420 [Nitrosococcus oceani]